MFSFMKKDKDKETKKEKEDRKREKKERKEKEKKEKHRDQTTPEELSRLEEVKRGVFRRRSDREKKKGQDSPVDDDDGGFLTRDSDSSTSLSSAERLSPGRQVPSDHGDVPRSGPPQILPKPKSILKAKGDRKHVSDNLDDTTVLRSNTAYNQANSGVVPQGQEKSKPKPVPRGTKPPFKDKPPEFMPPPPPESPPPEKSFKISLTLPAIIPAKPPRVRELVINRTKAGDFGFTLRKGVITQKEDGGDAKHTVIFAEPGAGQTSSHTGLIPGDRLIEVNSANVENTPREEIINMIRKTGDTVTLKVQPIPELIELSVRPSADGSVVDVQEEVVKGGTLKRSGSMRYKKQVKPL